MAVTTAGNVICFADYKCKPRPKREPIGPAEIVILPSVRIERHAGSKPPIPKYEELSP
jgi:hypothetical protein